MSKTKKNIDEFFPKGRETDEAMQGAVKKALLLHKRLAIRLRHGKAGRSSGFSLRTFILRINIKVLQGTRWKIVIIKFPPP